MTEPAIAVLPYGMRLGPDLARLPVSELLWPLGCPDRLKGAAVGDMRRTDHIIMFPNTMAHFRLRRGTKAQISLMMGEPAAIHAKHIRLLRYTWRRFFRVFTFHEELLTSLPNAVFLPYGTTWVPEWRDLKPEKTKSCSLIASAKRDTAGHQLRHAIVEWVRETAQAVDIMGRGYTPFDSKANGLAPYRYSIVIENVQEPNYFSEKLIDAILCGTVPIYWGCPNLDRFMDTAGMIICNSEADIRHAVETLSAEDFEQRLPLIQALQPVAARYCDLELRAAEALQKQLQQPDARPVSDTVG